MQAKVIADYVPFSIPILLQQNLKPLNIQLIYTYYKTSIKVTKEHMQYARGCKNRHSHGHAGCATSYGLDHGVYPITFVELCFVKIVSRVVFCKDCECICTCMYSIP